MVPKRTGRGPFCLIRQAASSRDDGQIPPTRAPRDFCPSRDEASAYGEDMAAIEIDNRGLQPPEPMVRILSSVAELGDGDELTALMDREPMLLYPELERRGFTWEFGPRDDHFAITIRRAAL